ncbi:MAG TPA: ATP-binding cassette domain-containing protein, partial [Ilumatobacteraceae bacterium]|nr:ATP-binding cassette domain-containing protein [Ilumatobacteraceae bacterium]
MSTGSTTDDAVLRVDDLHVNYRSGVSDVHAVRGVSFAVRAGERVGVVGESGSGKSSIALAMLGLIERPSQVRGSVRLKGRELTGASEKQLNAVRGKEIGLIYQDPMSALDPLRPIGAQIVEAIKAHRRDLNRDQLRDAAVALLAAVDVPNPQQRYRDYPHEYSGGMRQRVA